MRHYLLIGAGASKQQVARRGPIDGGGSVTMADWDDTDDDARSFIHDWESAQQSTPHRLIGSMADGATGLPLSGTIRTTNRKK